LASAQQDDHPRNERTPGSIIGGDEFRLTDLKIKHQTSGRRRLFHYFFFFFFFCFV
jgi:hypothetical protein